MREPDLLSPESIQAGSAGRCADADHQCSGLLCGCACHGPHRGRARAQLATESGMHTPGPTVLRIVTGAHPDIASGPGWLEHIALRGDCDCGDAVYFRTEEDGSTVGGWLARHANCKRKDQG